MMVEKGEKFGSFSIRTIQPDKTVSIRKNDYYSVFFCMVFYLLIHSGSPSLHNPGFQSKKICHKLMKLWCFTFFTTLTRPPYFPPPQKKPKNLWKIPKCRFLKKKLLTTTAGHGDDRSSQRRGEAVDLRFFFAERRCCGSNFRMETTIVPVTGTCTIWGPEARGDFFCLEKNVVCLLLWDWLFFFFGVFDTYFSYHHISCIIYHIMII